MKQLFDELNQMLGQGEEAVLVSVIASSGSVPRGAGARMLVKGDGSTRGTVGGGAVEYRAIQTAMAAMREKASSVRGFSLTKNQIPDLGMICGGEVTVYFQYLDPENSDLRIFCRQAAAAFGGEEDCWLVFVIAGGMCRETGLYCQESGVTAQIRESQWQENDRTGTGEYSKNDGEKDRSWKAREAAGCKELCSCLRELEKQYGNVFGSRAGQYRMGEKTYYIEPFVQAGTVYVFGGGHVARELVPVLSHVGFSCVVMDDRPEFANPQAFPDAERTVVGDLERIGDYLTIRRKDYVCVMTRGHAFDYLVQRQALACRPRYIGVIGSRNKAGAVTEKLMGDGFSREEIEACHMPIGTRIYAETPEEIAISIAGELIAVRAGHGS